jgi:hypothetical protein
MALFLLIQESDLGTTQVGTLWPNATIGASAVDLEMAG